MAMSVFDGHVGFDRHDGLSFFLLQDKPGKVRFFRRPFRWPTPEWRYSWGCFSSPSVVQIYGLQSCLFGGLFRSMTSRERFNSSEDLFGGRHQNGGGPGDAFPHPQKCRYTVCKDACLENLHGCRRPSSWDFSIRKNLRLWPQRLMVKPSGAYGIHPGLGLRGQECSSFSPAFQYCLSAGKTVAFEYSSEADQQEPVPVTLD